MSDSGVMGCGFDGCPSVPDMAIALKPTFAARQKARAHKEYFTGEQSGFYYKNVSGRTVL